MTDEKRKTSAGDHAPAETPCNELLDEIGDILLEGVKPEGDPEAAIDKLSQVIGVYETSDLVEKADRSQVPTDEERDVMDQVGAQAQAQGLQGPKGDPTEGKP